MEVGKVGLRLEDCRVNGEVGVWRRVKEMCVRVVGREIGGEWDGSGMGD